MIEQESKNSFCFYAGLFGVLISAVTLFQMFIYSTGVNSVLVFIILSIIFSIVAFSFLMAKRWVALPLLLINSILFLLINLIFLVSISFSLLIVILFLYTIIIVTIFWTAGTPAYLKQLYKYKKQEEIDWKQKFLNK